MKAEPVYRAKSVLSDGAILEMVVWRVLAPVAGSRHDFKYRLFYGKHGRRLVGYDNERGKGDHKHIDGHEAPYLFTTVEQLLRDFLADVEMWRVRS